MMSMDRMRITPDFSQGGLRMQDLYRTAAFYYALGQFDAIGAVYIDDRRAHEFAAAYMKDYASFEISEAFTAWINA